MKGHMWGRFALLLLVLRYGERGFWIFKARQLAKVLKDNLVPREHISYYLEFAGEEASQVASSQLIHETLRILGLDYGVFERRKKSIQII